jgi:hypothetical protein
MASVLACIRSSEEHAAESKKSISHLKSHVAKISEDMEMNGKNFSSLQPLTA